MPTKKAKKTTKAKKVVKKAVRKVAKKATKKVTKKKTAKKAAKKTTRRKKGKSPLVYSSDMKSFWVSDGKILNSLVALRDALEAMDKAVYQYHTRGRGNDFAKWVEAVLSDKNCAKELSKAKTQKGARAVVVKHLKYYSF